MLALISDVHSNLEALVAVLADADAQGARDIVCLGDVVGYGPEPAATADLVRTRVSACVRGNHEEALLDGGKGFNGAARKAIEWTRAQLEPGLFAGPAARRRWAWLSSLPLTLARGSDLLVHGSPRDPTSEYLLASELAFGSTQKYEEIFETFERFLFVGHTHLPCVITDDYEAHAASELGDRYEHVSGKAIINTGSVGQPRDGDKRACYALVEGATVTWRRVPYDVEKTVAKMAAIEALEPRLSERLLVGT